MYPTRNDLPEATRTQVAELLNHRLADSIDLQVQAKVAHWNVRGPNFIALHKLFDRVADDMYQYTDLVAERAVQLGGLADGTVRASAERSELAEYPLVIDSESGHVRALATNIAAYGELVRRAIDAADELGDADTTDIFTQISRGVDKLLWMVEAHLGGTWKPDAETARAAPTRAEGQPVEAR